MSLKNNNDSSRELRVVTLWEYLPGDEPRVDREAGVIRGVKVLGWESANGHRYRREAVRAAREMYEGIKVNIDHPSLAKSGTQRRLSERFGRLANVRETEAGLFADLHFLKAHPLADLTAEAAERMPEILGLSHNAVGRVRTEGEETIVEEIVRVKSVDLVTEPATTASLFEQVAADERTSPAETQLHAEIAALLEEAGIAAEPILLKALGGLKKREEREDLLEAWRRRGGWEPSRPKSQTRSGTAFGKEKNLFEKENGRLAAFLRGE